MGSKQTDHGHRRPVAAVTAYNRSASAEEGMDAGSRTPKASKVNPAPPQQRQGRVTVLPQAGQADPPRPKATGPGGPKVRTSKVTSDPTDPTDAGSGRELLLKYVANSVVGKDVVFRGPYGPRRVLYLDYIASGRPLKFIEDYVTQEVLPLYANTHTTTSFTARQTTALREDARKLIARTTNCTQDDVVIFVGNGVTGAIHKLIHALNFTHPPVVIIGPYEHHSNILPWRELGAEVVRINQTTEGVLDLEHLEEELKKWSKTGRRIVGSMSAASNVTGILCDVSVVSSRLHKYGALAFWDYATAGPYVQLDMNPAGQGQELAYIDAMMVSTHKFVGGVSAPGLLIAKRKLFVNKVPHNCGGGTVLVVRQKGHRYLENLEEREEGGTPAIVGAIRAGLVFQLKEALSPQFIMDREHQLFRRAREAWGTLPNLVILGSLDVDRLPVFSFLVRHPMTGYFLHHNFVACLLNDLFGIQARGGCACAGPYAMDLLGITEEQALQIEDLLVTDKKSIQKPSHPVSESKREIFKPGFTRLNLPYFIGEEQLRFVLQTVAMVSEHGWKLLPQYKFNPKTGEWKHENSDETKQQRHLDHLSYTQGFLEMLKPNDQDEDSKTPSYDQCLATARQIFAKAAKAPRSVADESELFEDFARPSRWFLLPSEASQVLRALAQISHLAPSRQFIVPRSSHVGGLLNGAQTSFSTSSSSPSVSSSSSYSNSQPPLISDSAPSASKLVTVTGLGGVASGSDDFYGGNQTSNGKAYHVEAPKGRKIEVGQGTKILVQGPNLQQQVEKRRL